MARLLPILLPRRQISAAVWRRLWNAARGNGRLWTAVDDLPTPTDQMLPCMLYARSGNHAGRHEQQAGRLICARICARDAAGQAETGKTQKTRDDFMPHVCRGQRGDWRLPETTETRVVWLITQRRQEAQAGASIIYALYWLQSCPSRGGVFFLVAMAWMTGTSAWPSCCSSRRRGNRTILRARG